MYASSTDITAYVFHLILAADSSYRGVEKWLPDIDDQGARDLYAIQEAVSALELPRDVHERAVELLELARDHGLAGAHPFEDVIGAVIYACRELLERIEERTAKATMIDVQTMIYVDYRA